MTYQAMKRHNKAKQMQSTMWKELLEGSIGLAFVSMMFWKRQNYEGVEVISGFREISGEKDGQEEHRINCLVKCRHDE